MQLCTMRESAKPDKGFYTWMKGGYNGESHNHNDVGSIGVYLDGKPLMIDIGIGTYTKFTFNEMRYTLFPIRSEHHNLPVINGKGEHEGDEYSSEVFEADESTKTVRIEYAKAYENNHEIKHMERKLSLNDGIITLNDNIELKNEGEIVFNFYLLNKPTLKENGGIEISEGVVMLYDKSFESEITDIALNDKTLERDWKKENIYRLRLKTNAVSVNTEFIIKHI